jgi:nitrogen fixation NifU-like protein
MSSDPRQLYQEVILDHSKRPRNFGQPEGRCFSAEGHNPLCGDQVTVYVRVEDGAITEVRFEGRGCAISTASASLMTETLKTKTPEEARQLFDLFRESVTSDPTSELDDEQLGKLAVLSGVREYPMRVKCASLAWHTMRAALDGNDEPVTTE